MRVNMKDSWCELTFAKNGSRVSGGAARNVRIAACGGMDAIIQAVAAEAAENALKRANIAVRKDNLRLLKKVG